MQDKRARAHCPMLTRHSTVYLLDLFSLCAFMLTLVSSFTSRTACAQDHDAQRCKASTTSTERKQTGPLCAALSCVVARTLH